MASRPQDRPQTRVPGRPLSPHLQIWRWGPHMLVSIVHRALGVGMALVGAPLFVWWLAAAAGGEESYATFTGMFAADAGNLNIVGYVLGVGLTWAALQHMLTGIRHLVLDTGAGYELRRNKLGATATLAVSALLTIGYWAYIVVGR